MPAKIFVSYRRDDDPNAAARVRDGLAGQFGQANVFMDVDNLLAGQRFDIKLAEALAACDLLIAVIGPRWMDLLKAKLDSGERDYVREEIAAAMKRGITVIPVRVGREGIMPKMPRADDLPEDIREFVLHQKHDVAYERFGRDIAELNEAILELRKETAGSGKPQGASTPWGKVAATVAGLAVLVGVGGYAAGLFGKSTAPPVQAVAPGTSAAEAEKKRVADLQAEIVRRDAALAKEQAERQRIEAEATKLRADADARQKAETKRLADAAEATRREQEARAKAATEAEAKRKADEAERQRTAAASAKATPAEPVARGRSLIDGLYKPPPDPAAGLAPGQSFRDCNDVCPEMVVIPAGSFTMGSPATEADRSDNEGPQRKVTIARSFAVGKFEVTFTEWDACVADRGCTHKPGDEGWGRGKRPVINVTWDDATQYVAWLSRKTSQSYRLLTEAEWEYAARAGTTTPFSTGRTITTAQSNFDGNYTYGGSAKGQYRQRTIEVGSFAANPFGLHDMHGNVWEWVEDCYVNNYNRAPVDGSARTSQKCNLRVLRGGSWNDGPKLLRAASRNVNIDLPIFRVMFYGFRLARTLSTPP